MINYSNFIFYFNCFYGARCYTFLFTNRRITFLNINNKTSIKMSFNFIVLGNATHSKLL